MKFTNALLASLLFFGVTPLALNRKRDEQALVATSIPFATTSAIHLATPDTTGISEVTGGSHGVLEARARGSRGGSRKKTTRPSRTKKTKTKKTKTKKTSPKTKKAKPKKNNSKGKAKSKCTVKQKKAGKCPNQKKKRNWEVLFPTKGCKPKSCKKCGKATGTKGSKKGNKKTARDLHSPTVAKRAATFEPASKDEAGLNQWTKDVWASSPKVLHMPENSYQPTSIFMKWSSLGEGIKFVTVKSLMGCTSVVAVSDEGVYVSHHWQNTVGDAAYRDLPPQFANGFTNPLTGKRRASFRLTPEQKKKALRYETEADVKSAVHDVFPTTGFVALTDVESSFTAASNVQSMVAVWNGRYGDGDIYETTGAVMKKFVDSLLPGTATKLVEYDNPKDNARSSSRDDADYHGKVIVSYNSATKKYQVWMAGAKMDGPILEN